MTSLLEAKNLSVIRNRRSILQDVSLKVGEGDFITVIGPNGAGKSMLLKCLLGFYKPDSGHVERREKLRIAYMPQHINADQTMPITVRRFLTLRQTTDKQHLEETAELTDIQRFIDKPIQVLSGGELQRVLMARALLKRPHLMVLDEPAQNLDVSGQLAFYAMVDNIYKQQALSVLMVSHDLHMVMASTRQVICLFHHVCCTGTPQVVTKDPEFISLFGNDMAKLMALYRHSHDHNHLHDIGNAIANHCEHH